ncbi:chemotaxis protein CheX [Brevibacillus fulvus]|uniref:Chemotaxis protein CheX n=1 Tax=Brevibacillus fulvus TaxID=1125967 RepID=A0A938Y138_9BACL|nr:chemotaxis protein CheX [Brevibacillus fulvus]MBM7590076.1 chemotaxis protein CheX [Brevibacillus fulvus]
MSVQYINPFLESASNILQQMCNVEITRGELSIKEVSFKENHVWIRIGLTGEVQGNVMFGLSHDVALKIVSAMMGGFPIQEMDEMGKSAIAELGNMISGNASSILYTQGITIDITPPQLLEGQELPALTGEALTVPLEISDLGKLDIQVIVAK